MTSFTWLESATQVSRKNDLNLRWGRRKGCVTDGTSLQGVVLCVDVRVCAHCIYVHVCIDVHPYVCSLVIFSLFPLFPTESRWLKAIRRSPRARCLPTPSLCRRAARNIRKRTQRFQSTLQSFPRSAQRGGRYLDLCLAEGITSYGIC